MWILFGLAQANTCPKTISSLIGAYVPQCNGDLWNNVQCHGSTGYCWCVDQYTGQKIEKTPRLIDNQLIC